MVTSSPSRRTMGVEVNAAANAFGQNAGLTAQNGELDGPAEGL